MIKTSEKLGDIRETATVAIPSTEGAVASEQGLCKQGCGRCVQSGVTKKGKSYDTCCKSCALAPGSGVHDAVCPGFPAGTKGSELTVFMPRPVCERGSHCRNRTAAHLKDEAHPLDQDYEMCCKEEGVEPEELTLKVVFNWADTDGSGKLSRDELQSVMYVVSQLTAESVFDDETFEGPDRLISEEAWKRLDEDGNGVLNFNEFACWAGPRFGLPLGVKKLMRSLSQQSHSVMAPCSVQACPCEDFDGDTGGKKDPKCKRCKHKRSCHKAARPSEDQEIQYPEYWDTPGDDATSKFTELVEMVHLKEFQDLLDGTYSSTYTRDRKRHNPENPNVPSKFKVVRVLRNENSESWQEFSIRRAVLLDRFYPDVDETNSRRLGRPADEDPLERYEVETCKAWQSDKSKGKRLAKEVNEWYLFHGTNPKVAKLICEGDFQVRTSGSNTGTLYGRGLYFAESITKSDEYAKPDENGNYAVLLCRVLGGRVLYNDEETPDPDELVHQCVEGPYDCVMGDRKKIKGTYREFVVFDTEDVYAEYLIEYRRVYD